MFPIVLALAVVAPAVYSVTEYVQLRRAPPLTRRKRRAARVRVLLGVGVSLVALVLTLAWSF